MSELLTIPITPENSANVLYDDSWWFSVRDAVKSAIRDGHTPDDVVIHPSTQAQASTPEPQHIADWIFDHIAEQYDDGEYEGIDIDADLPEITALASKLAEIAPTIFHAHRDQRLDISDMWGSCGGRRDKQHVDVGGGMVVPLSELMDDEL